jgi:uncharacterized protein YbaR (Trm112 family)
MSDNPENKPPEPPAAAVIPESAPPEASRPEPEEFPERLYCPQCRRMYPVKNLRAKANTLLTEAALVCPRCRRKLRRMKLKDWYDHYVQGQEIDFVMDTHGFVHRDSTGEAAASEENPEPMPQPSQDRGARFSQNNRNRRGGRNDNRGRDPRQGQPNQKKSILPQNVRAYRLPKRRRFK